MSEPLRVLTVAEHASARFGGEAALPLHYFRVLRGRGVPVWLVTHARTRAELSALYQGDERIVYVEDSAFHRAMWQIGRRLPDAISYPTIGFLSRLATQRIDVVHQQMPVSPREPSLLHRLGAPLVIGPMNGGMDYPPPFRRRRGPVERGLIGFGRASAAILNRLWPGKRRAAALLVANERIRRALPDGVCPNVLQVVENGVDLGLWQAPPASAAPGVAGAATTFAFMGRLVDWKAVDLVVRAFAVARRQAPMRLWILGDGGERAGLEALAEGLGLAGDTTTVGAVHFAGWLPQAECVARLREADALVLPSLLECGGAVVLEAMSMAKPVVATAWGGPLDYLDAECGILVEPTSRDGIVEGFARAMVELAASPGLRLRFGAHGLAKVRRDFDWEIKADRILEIYAAVAGRPHSAPPSAARSTTARESTE